MTSIFDGKIMKVEDRDLVFFDTETTGLALLKSELIEIGFVKAKAKTFEFIEEGDIKIKPSHIATAAQESLEIVGYNEEEWANAVDLKTGLTNFLKHTEEAILVAHNLPFDWMFINKAIEDCGLRANFFYKGFDTFPIAWMKFRSDPKFEKFSISELTEHFAIDKGRQHRAIDDARTAYKLFLELIKQ